VKDGDNPLLQNGAHVDEDISTTHQIHVGEGGIVEDVLSGEDAHIPHAFADLVAVLYFAEETT
jgi:hypothetical protein